MRLASIRGSGLDRWANRAARNEQGCVVSKSKANKMGIAVSGRQKNGVPTDPRINRTLEVIVGELHSALKTEVIGIIEIGELLVEAKEHVGHGEWLPWLRKELSMSTRTAQRYMK